VIRQFRPDVVVTIFSGTPADGHGQHQAAGILAREAFTAAGDPTRFPEQLENGLRAHQPARLFQARWRGGGPSGVVLQTGTFDPLLGRSYHQIALESRGRHRSQDMGRALTPGPHQVTLQQIAGEGDGTGSLFAGLETTLSARARTLIGTAGGRGSPASAPSAAAADSLIALLQEYDGAIPSLRAAFNPLASNDLVPELARLIRILEDADRLTGALSAANEAGPDNKGQKVASSGAVNITSGDQHPSSAPLSVALSELHFHLTHELDDARTTLARAAGIVIDAIASHERLVQGQSFEVDLIAWNGGGAPVLIGSLGPRLPV
jgi:hypothetical protein